MTLCIKDDFMEYLIVSVFPSTSYICDVCIMSHVLYTPDIKQLINTMPCEKLMISTWPIISGSLKRERLVRQGAGGLRLHLPAMPATNL
jgi:hypothetical protein